MNHMEDLVLIALNAASHALQLAFESLSYKDYATRARYRALAFDLAREVSRRHKALALEKYSLQHPPVARAGA